MESLTFRSLSNRAVELREDECTKDERDEVPQNAVNGLGGSSGDFFIVTML